MAYDDELTETVDALHEIFAKLRQLSGEQTEAVVHAPSATTYLFPEMQVELNRMEQIERHSAEERAAILDALPAHLAILDETGTITAVNEAWRAFARKQDFPDGAAAVGLNYLDICRACSGAEAGEARAVGAGIEAILSERKSTFTFEYSCLTPQGLLWFLLSVVPLRAGETTGAVVMHLDITERHAARRREEGLRAGIERLMDQAGLGILVHRNNTPLFANPALVQILGLQAQEEILALADLRMLFDLPHIGQHPPEQITGATNLREAAPLKGQSAVRRKDGTPVLLELHTFGMLWEAEPAVCTLFTDITEKQRIEDQLRASQKLEAVGQLTAGIAHDFNNLLTIILGSSELLADALENAPDLARLAAQTMMAAERGAELTRRLLAFARLQPLRPQRTDVNQQLLALEEVMQRTLGSTIEIKMSLSAEPWPAMIDPAELDNAILNLSINSRDAMPSGGHLLISTANIEVTEEASTKMPELAPGFYVLVNVTDDGTGMSELTLAHIFEPFFTTKDVGKGSGLGLSMVFGFVKQSSGHIRVTSVPGQGTSVELFLPRDPDSSLNQ